MNMRALNTSCVVTSASIIAFYMLYVWHPLNIVYFPQLHEWGLHARSGHIGMTWYGYNVNALVGSAVASMTAYGLCRYAAARLEKPLSNPALFALCGLVILAFGATAIHTIYDQKKWFDKEVPAASEVSNSENRS
ncbi:MAG: hypothetical protein AMXMBFR84_05950 [Candidatus Hydrogenedentota bacterium]